MEVKEECDWSSRWYAPLPFDQKHCNGKTVAYFVKLRGEDAFSGNVRRDVNTRCDTLEEARGLMHSHLTSFLEALFCEMYSNDSLLREEADEEFFKHFSLIKTGQHRPHKRGRAVIGRLHDRHRDDPTATANVVDKCVRQSLPDVWIEGGIYELKCNL